MENSNISPEIKLIFESMINTVLIPYTGVENIKSELERITTQPDYLKGNFLKRVSYTIQKKMVLKELKRKFEN